MKISDKFFRLISAIVIQAWHLIGKTITLLHKTVCISSKKTPKTSVKNASELCE
jgi:hypothetical protein